MELPHPLAGSVAQVASPIRLSETPVEYRQAPPLLGQHTEQILRRLLNKTPGQIDDLRQGGVI
ncbi:Succinyl-CoA:(R)-benzylsuccinate CoA-transferase subunit BbsF [compost metagenome]